MIEKQDKFFINQQKHIYQSQLVKLLKRKLHNSCLVKVSLFFSYIDSLALAIAFLEFFYTNGLRVEIVP